jgi:hypothetical protein
MKTPVALFIFKRPHTTEKVIDAIRQAKPRQLFVIANAPRNEVAGELEKCKATRAIIEQVDWDCEVVKNYSETHLSVTQRIYSGLDWIFSNVEEVIILEDDCVAHPTFFPFCEELLDKYRYDNRVASISGQNVQFGQRRTNYSYYFSLYNHCWGWASWRRAWQNYDLYMKLWPEIKAAGLLKDILRDNQAINYWNHVFQNSYDNPLGITWDYQWTFACWLQNSLGIISNVNLISNIGFGADSTHFTSQPRSKYDSLPTEAMEFPLKHPPFMIRNLKADNFTQSTLFKETLLNSIKQRIKKIPHFLKKPGI